MLEKCKHSGLTWILALIPVLSLYGIPSLNLDFGTMLALLGIIYIMIKEKRLYLILSGKRIWFAYIVYMVLSLSFPYLWGDNIGNSIIARTGKNIIYILILLISTSAGLVDYQLFRNCYLKISKLATLFILMQSIAFYGFHRVIPGYINFLLISDGYGDRLSQAVTGLFRPTSFFYEPSHYFEYVAPALIICLFENETKNKDIYIALLITLGVVFSTSGMGGVAIAICWGIWIIKKTKRLIVEKKALLISCIFIVTGLIFMRTSYAQSIYNRVFGNSASGVTYTAVNARTDIYKVLFDQDMFSILFGNGYGNTLDAYYYPSWAFNVRCLGIIGTAIIVGIYIKYFRITHRIDTRMILFINAFLCIGTTLFMGKNMLLYFLIVILQVQEIEYGKKINCYNGGFVLPKHHNEWQYSSKNS